MSESEVEELRRRLALVTDQVARMGSTRSGEEDHEIRQATARFDAAGAVVGERASPHIPGESSRQYRARLLNALAKRTTTYRQSRFDSLDAPALDLFEDRVFREVREIAQARADTEPGRLLAIEERDPSGRVITKYAGDPLCWMSPFMRGGQVCVGNRRPKGE